MYAHICIHTYITSYLFTNCIYIIQIFVYRHTYTHIYTHHIFFIHSVDGRLNYSHVFKTVNSAADIGVHVSFQIRVFAFSRSGIAESYGKSTFNFFKGTPHCFPYGCTNLHFHQMCRRVLFSPQLLQHL